MLKNYFLALALESGPDLPVGVLSVRPLHHSGIPLESMNSPVPDTDIELSPMGHC